MKINIVAPRPILRKIWRRPFLENNGAFNTYSPGYLFLPARCLPSNLVIRFNSLNYFLASLQVLNGIKLDFRPDVIHVHGIRYFGLLIPKIKQVFNCPVVWTVHGADPYLNDHAQDRSLRKALIAAEQSTDQITVVGKSLIEYMEKLGLNKAPLEIVHNGTELPFSSSGLKEQIRDKFGNCTLILSVSNLNYQKGIHLNIVALSKIARKNETEFHYIVIGDGPERKRLEGLVLQNSMQDKVTFLGRLPHPETMAYMDACDIFSLPSMVEAFGIVFLEAMARGKAVIGCEETGAAEIIKSDAEGYLVKSGDVDRLSDAIDYLINNPEERSIMGNAATNRAKFFTWDNNAMTYFQMYSQLTGSIRAV